MLSSASPFLPFPHSPTHSCCCPCLTWGQGYVQSCSCLAPGRAARSSYPGSQAQLKTAMVMVMGRLSSLCWLPGWQEIPGGDRGGSRRNLLQPLSLAEPGSSHSYSLKLWTAPLPLVQLGTAARAGKGGVGKERGILACFGGSKKSLVTAFVVGPQKRVCDHATTLPCDLLLGVLT